MSNILKDITVKAVQLPRHQRLVLAGFLLDLDDADKSEVDQEWEEEIKSRIQAFDAGLIESDSYEEIQRKMKKRFAQ
jgi:predicted GTPase